MTIQQKIKYFLGFINTNKAYSILDDMSEYGMTFNQGGCLILADALTSIFKGHLIAIARSKDDAIEHFGYYVEGVGIVDFSGLYTDKEYWLRYFAEEEWIGSGGLHLINFIVREVPDSARRGIIRNKECSKAIADEFQTRIDRLKVENLFKPECVRTVGGRYVNIVSPDQDTIDIEDIAHSLSMIPRFGGHLEEFYSVAQHSVECMRRASNDIKFETLMHDASEAYLLDIPSPLKKTLPDYKKVEGHFMEVLADKYNLDYPFDPRVKEIDNALLKSEWESLALHLSATIKPWGQKQAKEEFLKAFYSLRKKR